MTTESATGRELAPRRVLDDATRRALDEVAHHSRGRTGKVARAIEAGLVSLQDDSVLALDHREALEEFAGMVSESAGVGVRCVYWRAAVYALLRALRPDPGRVLVAKLAAALTPQQVAQFARPLSEQQHDFLQQVYSDITSIRTSSG